ncbi:MAG: hypothetical protein U0670_17070 [Anaerolineae bacterium]
MDRDLYDIAQQRVNRRNRRWILWSINLTVLIFTLAGLIFLGDSVHSTLAAAVFFGWGGVFVFHSMLLAMAESREHDIEKEVARLRSAYGTAEDSYSKPKRLELADDGELRPAALPDTPIEQSTPISGSGQRR